MNRRELERIEIPGEHQARERAWYVVRSAYAERELLPRSRSFVRPAIALAAVLAMIAAAASSPGRAVIADAREAIGVADTEPALFSLPTGGRLLATSDEGAWIVHADGSKRRLGQYHEAAWSPYGRFVAATRENELVAVEPDGDVRWTLARPDARDPAWGGTRTDTRIAYGRSAAGLGVVAGDGHGDRAGCADVVARVRPAWRPGLPHTLAFVAPNGVVHTYRTDTCRLLWRSASIQDVRELQWSHDGRLLLVRSTRDLRVLGDDGRLRFHLLGPAAAPVVAASFSPTGNSIAFVQRARGRSTLWLTPRLRPDASAARRIFEGTGTFTDVAWSPDRRWLLVAWREPDQWVFIQIAGTRRIEGVSQISAQFGGSFPALEGWCCASSR